MLKGLFSNLGRFFRFPTLSGGVLTTAFSLAKLGAVAFVIMLFFAPDKLSALGTNWQSSYGPIAISAALIAALFALIRALSSGVSLLFWFVIVSALSFKMAPSSFSDKFPKFLHSKRQESTQTIPIVQKPQSSRSKGPEVKNIGNIGEAFWFKDPVRVQPTVTATNSDSQKSISNIFNLENLKLKSFNKSGSDSAFAGYDDSIYFGKKSEE